VSLAESDRCIEKVRGMGRRCTITFAAAARTLGESWHRVTAVYKRYVDLAVAATDLSRASSVVIDETSHQRGHKYLTIVPMPRPVRLCASARGRRR
jgi:transposase